MTDEELQKAYTKQAKKDTKQMNQMWKASQGSSLIEKPKDLFKQAASDQKHQEHEFKRGAVDAQRNAEKLQKAYTKQAKKDAKQMNQMWKASQGSSLIEKPKDLFKQAASDQK